MKLTIWLNSLVIFYFAGLFCARSQTITLEQVQQKARNHYPLARQQGLLQESNERLLQNINKAYLPQLLFNGQASYQSDVTRINVPVPGLELQAPAKDQYRFTVELTQSLYDGGMRKSRQLIQQLSSETESQRVEVELYKLREQINQYYLTILLLEEQILQATLVQKDITIGINRTQAQVANGITFRSNLNLLQAEHLKAGQRLIELQNTRSGYLQALALLTGEPFNQNTQLVRPVVADIDVVPEIYRPELVLYNKQLKVIEAQKKITAVALRPGLSFFTQGGYGRPGLNLLSNEFDTYYVTGLRFTWRLNNWYTNRNDQKILDLNKTTTNLQHDTFLLNLQVQLTRENAEINKLKQLIRSDQEIITLRESVKNAVRAQLENAVITANDFLREVNAEDQARQNLIIHQMQLLQSQLNLKTISGN